MERQDKQVLVGLIIVFKGNGIGGQSWQEEVVMHVLMGL